jgi:uncharacterized protein (TIGR02266 family)
VTSRQDLIEAAIGRARDARAGLAPVQAALRQVEGAEVEPVRRILARVVGALHAAEIGEVGLVQEALSEALGGLAELRGELPRLPGHDALPGASNLDGMVRDLTVPRDAIARALAAPQITIPIDLSSENNFYTGFSGTLSDGGVFVATYDLLPEGTALQVEIRLTSERPIATLGIVEWVRQAHGDVFPGIGLSLPELDAGEVEAIDRFMRRREPLFHDA